MLHVTSAQVITGHRLLLQFDDGTHGEVDIAAELRGPIFEELLYPDKFNEAYLLCCPRDTRAKTLNLFQD